MIKNIYSCRDVKADTFSDPFATINAQVAIRGFADEINNSESRLSQHPEDYSLYEIGSFDPSTGVLTAFDVPKLISEAAPLVNGPRSQKPSLVSKA